MIRLEEAACVDDMLLLLLLLAPMAATGSIALRIHVLPVLFFSVHSKGVFGSIGEFERGASNSNNHNYNSNNLHNDKH
jgi:hypothetical protein